MFVLFVLDVSAGGSCLMFVVGCRVLTLDCWVIGVAFSGCCLCLVVGCWLLIVVVGCRSLV